MKTHEMVALAEKDGKTYKSRDMFYNKEQGFHNKDNDEWPVSAWNIKNGLKRFVLNDGWEVVEPKKMTIEDIKKELGYDFEIIDSPNTYFDRFLNSERIAIHCETKKEAKKLFTMLEEKGIRWCNGKEINDNLTYWEEYGDVICYDNRIKGLSYWSRRHYEEEGYEIVEFKDLQ